jgi:hypothetical protein
LWPLPTANTSCTGERDPCTCQHLQHLQQRTLQKGRSWVWARQGNGSRTAGSRVGSR